MAVVLLSQQPWDSGIFCRDTCACVRPQEVFFPAYEDAELLQVRMLLFESVCHLSVCGAPATLYAAVSDKSAPSWHFLEGHQRLHTSPGGDYPAYEDAELLQVRDSLAACLQM